MAAAQERLVEVEQAVVEPAGGGRWGRTRRFGRMTLIRCC